jgi:2-keto-4-pentenoate hydratase
MAAETGTALLPTDMVDAMRRQLRRRQAVLDAGADHVGWKMARGIEAVEERIGKGPALTGYLTSASRVQDGGAFSAGDAAAPRVDCELALEVGADVPAEATLAEARAALAGVGLALEYVDVAPPPGGLEPAVVENLTHRGYVLGPSLLLAVPVGARAAALVNGEERASTVVEDTAAETLAEAARVLAAAGARLRAGDRIIAGSLVQVAVGPGDTVAVEIEGLDRLTATVVP